MPQKEFEDEALLHKNSCQVQGELTESLGVDYTTVSKCLKALGMIQKQGHYVPYELKPRDVKWRTATSTAENEKFFASFHDQR